MEESTRHTFFNFIRREKEVLVFALFVSVYLLLQLFKFPDFRVNDFSSFLFGEATSRNVSIGRRISYFYNGMFAFAGLFSAFYFLFKFLIRRFNPSKIRIQTPFYLAGLGSVLALVNIFGADSKNFTGILLFLFVLIFLINLFARESLLRPLLNPTILISLLIYSFLLYSGVIFLVAINEDTVAGSIWWFLLALIHISILYLLFEKKLGSRKALLVFQPLIWVPIITFLSAEVVISIKYSGNPLMDYQIIFLILFVLTYVLTLTVFRKKLYRLSFKGLVSKYFVIGVLSSLAIFTFYSPIVHYPLELFESANPANAQMRLFEYGEIPFVDFMSSHMVQEQWSGWIYHLIHGYSGDFSFMAYFFFNDVLFLILLFFLLKEILKDHLTALVVIICLPFLGELFNPSLLLGVLPIFYLRNLIRKTSIIDYLKLYWVVIFMVFWKLDTGFACLVASSIGLILLWIGKQIEFKFKEVAISLAITIVILGLGLGLTFILRSPEYVMENMTAALHYFKAGQAHGFSQLTWEVDQNFYIHYVFMPLIAILLVLVSLFEMRSGEIKQKVSFVHLAGIFFMLFFLGNFQRGLVRHSFMEGLDFFWSSFFFTGLIFFLIHWFGKGKRNRIFAFLLFGNLCLFVFFKAFPIGQRKMMIETAIAYPTHLGFKQHLVESMYDNRVEIEDELKAEYEWIVNYLKEELEGEETFYDFTNTPILYYLTQKSQPSYFCQNLQNTVGDFLQLKQIEDLKKADVPLLLYSNEPMNFWDRTDNVDNTLRYYLIAEYLFQNYEPDTIVGTKWVWKASAFEGKERKTNLKTYRFVDYGKSAGLWTEYLKKEGSVLAPITLIFEEKQKGAYSKVEVSEDLLNQSRACFLQLSFDLKTEMYPEEFLDWTVQLMDGKKVVGTARFEGFENHEVYTIRLSNYYNWQRGNVDGIRIIPGHLSKQRMKLRGIQLVKDKRF